MSTRRRNRDLQGTNKHNSNIWERMSSERLLWMVRSHNIDVLMTIEANPPIQVPRVSSVAAALLIQAPPSPYLSDRQPWGVS
jgi:hypothetical protein